MSAASLLRRSRQCRLRIDVLCPLKSSYTLEARVYSNVALARTLLPGAPADAGPSTFPTEAEPSRNWEISLGRSLLEHTKVEEHLQALQSNQQLPFDIEELERHRPRSLSDPNSVQYELDYKALLDTLMRSFSKKQLRQCCRLYGMEGKITATSRSKQDYARAIVEKQWGWPSLHEIRQRQQAWVQEVRSYALDPRQSFIILGKDGSELLALSTKYDVHVTLSSNPLCLNASGRRGSLDKLAARIQVITSDIREAVLELPTRGQLSSDLLQRISRLTGAFVETFGKPGQLRISARDERSISLARRLAIRAAFEVESSQDPSLLAHLPPVAPRESSTPASIFPDTYSVYPFLASRPLSWTVITNGTFRVRKVTEWLDSGHGTDMASASTSFLSRGSLLDQTGQSVDLKALLLEQRRSLSASSGMQTAVTASLGHILVPSSSGNRAIISPPLQGSWPFSKIIDWWKNHRVKPIFVSSRPDSLLATKGGEQILHRLVYLSHPNRNSDVPLDMRKVLKFEVVLQASDAYAEYQGYPLKTTDMEHNEPQQSTAADLPTSDTDAVSRSLAEDLMPPTCLEGRETFVDLMIPDRPMDMRLTTSCIAPLPADRWPTALTQYFSLLQAFLTKGDAEAVQPESPLTLIHDGESYVLHSNSSVRRGPPTEVTNEVQVVTENALDLESEQQSAICEIINANVGSETAWQTFLVECDRLTAGKVETKARSIDREIDMV